MGTTGNFGELSDVCLVLGENQVIGGSLVLGENLSTSFFVLGERFSTCRGLAMYTPPPNRGCTHQTEFGVYGTSVYMDLWWKVSPWAGNFLGFEEETKEELPLQALTVRQRRQA